ncbi:MAG: 2-C-methyl-D-erythritol 4-phosphate cytidylyltransferase [Candidatus Omnitrophota bacterium]|jgi:2-C-methyl-D-erythritol 4-phosphate cytidylyltransferase
MSKTDIYIVLPSAGSGLRLGSKTPKPFIPIHGKPLFVWTIQAFKKKMQAKEIILAIDMNLEARYIQALRRYRLQNIRLVPGGALRADSVFKAVNAIEGLSGIVMIHDVARPLLDEEPIVDLIKMAVKRGAALLAEKASATVKQVKRGSMVVEQTLDREQIYLAQTPQAFQLSVLRNAYKLQKNKISAFTDEASIVEACGKKVVIVPGTSLNFKITTKADLKLARKLLKK